MPRDTAEELYNSLFEYEDVPPEETDEEDDASDDLDDDNSDIADIWAEVNNGLE